MTVAIEVVARRIDNRPGVSSPVRQPNFVSELFSEIDYRLLRWAQMIREKMIPNKAMNELSLDQSGDNSLLLLGQAAYNAMRGRGVFPAELTLKRFRAYSLKKELKI